MDAGPGCRPGGDVPRPSAVGYATVTSSAWPLPGAGRRKGSRGADRERDRGGDTTSSSPFAAAAPDPDAGRRSRDTGRVTVFALVGRPGLGLSELGRRPPVRPLGLGLSELGRRPPVRPLGRSAELARPEPADPALLWLEDGREGDPSAVAPAPTFTLARRARIRPCGLFGPGSGTSSKAAAQGGHEGIQ